MNPDQWLETNYKNISKMCAYYTTDKSLITHFYIWLVKHPNRWVKISSMSDTEQMKFTNTWLKNNAKWENSEFNKDKRVNSFDEVWDDDYEDIIFQDTISIEIGSEDVGDDVKGWLIDIENEFGDNADKLIKIRYIYLEMDTLDKVLYDLYFTKEMTLRAIAKHLSIPLVSVHQMVTELKKKIRTKCGVTQSIA